MTLEDRLRRQLNQFAVECPGWSAIVASLYVQPSSPCFGEGRVSLWAKTVDNVFIEVPLLPDDDVPATLGQSVH